MARIPSHGQSLFPGWLRPSSQGSALMRAEDIDWQSALSDVQGQADLLNFLSTQIGDYIRDIGGLTYSGGQIHLAYNDAAGASQTVSVDIATLAQGVVPIVGHTLGWVPTRVPVSDFGVTETAIWAYSDSGLMKIGDELGNVNGVSTNPPGSSGAWRNGASNGTARFWARRGAGQHVNYFSATGGHSGEHRHETDNGEIYGIAADAGNLWLLLYDSGHSALRLLTYTVDSDGAQDPAPNQTIDHTTITHDLPAGSSAPDDIGGVVYYDGRVYVLVRGSSSDGLPVTRALAYDTTYPFSRQASDDRFYGISSDVVDGFFTTESDWILQDHWLVKYIASSILGHDDTPAGFGAAGYPLIVNAARTAVEFGRINAASIGNGLTHLGDNLALSHESLTVIPNVDLRDYEYIVAFVRDIYNRYSGAFILPYSRINGMTETSETTLAAAGNHAIITSAQLDSHRVSYGLVRQSTTGFAVGQVREARQPAMWTEIGSYTGTETNGTSWYAADFAITEPPDNGFLGWSFGQEGGAILEIDGADFWAKEHISQPITTPSDSNGVFLRGAVGRDVWVGRLREVMNGQFFRFAPAFFVTHSGHHPYPLKVYRSWGSNITDLTVHAEVYGLGRR